MLWLIQKGGHVLNNDFAKECKIRDCYMKNLKSLRPNEICISKELPLNSASLRVDMQTVDTNNIFRDWEFKIYADYKSLGQLLTYIAYSKLENGFSQDVLGVIAAFSFQPELEQTIRIWGLPIELVKIPTWMKNAGNLYPCKYFHLPVDYTLITQGGN